MPESKPEKLASTTLRREHQIILRVLGVLERLLVRFKEEGRFEGDSLGRCVEFFQLFADACHHAKEENLLFPLLETRGIPNQGGPIGVMLYEHSLARQFTRNMAEALEAAESGDAGAIARFRENARQYLELLRQHIFKEDNILFSAGDRVMDDSDQATLCSQFGEVGCRAFGGKTSQDLERIADHLESRWPPAGAD